MRRPEAQEVRLTGHRQTRTGFYTSGWRLVHSLVADFTTLGQSKLAS